MIRLPPNALVVLIGPSGAGKSTWAADNFRAGQVVASDDLRAMVGEGPHDQKASKDAFELLDHIVERRLRRGLLTVIDSTGLDQARRLEYIDRAHRHGVRCHAIIWDTPAAECRARNRERERPVPAGVLTGQIKTWETLKGTIAEEPFDAVHQPGPVVVVTPGLLAAPAFATRQKEDPITMNFGLQIPSFTWPGGPEQLADRLSAIGQAAEAAHFSSLWVMDHFLQIFVVGPEWQEMLESYTALSFLAARTERVRLGTLVTGVTYRNVAHLGKIIATLDVLSGGRAICGIGAAWFEREHESYGWRFPPLKERYELLEDALQLLPLMWGPGSPSFEGKLVKVPEAMCYPRPLQPHVPIMIGGAGERRTLALVAKYADMCNLFGDAATVRHKLDVLAGHCDTVGRNVDDIAVTHLSTTLVGSNPAELQQAVERHRPATLSPETFAARVNAGTVDDQIGRFRELAEAGVDTAIVSLPDVADEEAVARFGEVITAFEP